MTQRNAEATKTAGADDRPTNPDLRDRVSPDDLRGRRAPSEDEQRPPVTSGTEGSDPAEPASRVETADRATSTDWAARWDRIRGPGDVNAERPAVVIVGTVTIERIAGACDPASSVSMAARVRVAPAR